MLTKNAASAAVPGRGLLSGVTFGFATLTQFCSSPALLVHGAAAEPVYLLSPTILAGDTRRARQLTGLMMLAFEACCSGRSRSRLFRCSTCCVRTPAVAAGAAHADRRRGRLSGELPRSVFDRVLGHCLQIWPAAPGVHRAVGAAVWIFDFAVFTFLCAKCIARPSADRAVGARAQDARRRKARRRARVAVESLLEARAQRRQHLARVRPALAAAAVARGRRRSAIQAACALARASASPCWNAARCAATCCWRQHQLASGAPVGVVAGSSPAGSAAPSMVSASGPLGLPRAERLARPAAK